MRKRSGDTYRFNVCAAKEKVGRLKERVAEFCGMLAERFELTLNEMPVDDPCASLADIGIVDGSVLFLGNARHIRVWVNQRIDGFESEPYSLKLGETTTLRELKEQFSKRSRRPSDGLHFNTDSQFTDDARLAEEELSEDEMLKDCIKDEEGGSIIKVRSSSGSDVATFLMEAESSLIE